GAVPQRRRRPQRRPARPGPPGEGRARGHRPVQGPRSRRKPRTSRGCLVPVSGDRRDVARADPVWRPRPGCRVAERGRAAPPLRHLAQHRAASPGRPGARGTDCGRAWQGPFRSRLTHLWRDVRGRLAAYSDSPALLPPIVNRVGQVEWAYGLAKDLLKAELPRRWAHTQGVAEQAETLAPILGADTETLIAACLLHDIGYAPDLVDTGMHQLDGARYLRDVAGADERLYRLVAYHSCADNEARQRNLLDV